MIRKIFAFLVVLLCSVITVFAAGDLVVSLGEPVVQSRDGYSQEVFVPFLITNVGDEPILSRFPVLFVNPSSRSGVGYPLYQYVDTGVPLILPDGTSSVRELTVTRLMVDGGELDVPAVHLLPGESLSFHNDLVVPLATFSYSSSGTYTLGYEVDPHNEIVEADDSNNVMTTSLSLSVMSYVKGPTDYLTENQYWFYFPEKEGCSVLDVPEPREFCLISYTPFTATLTIDDETVMLWHFFEIFGWSKTFDNLELVSADGFVVTYS